MAGCCFCSWLLLLLPLLSVPLCLCVGNLGALHSTSWTGRISDGVATGGVTAFDQVLLVETLWGVVYM